MLAHKKIALFITGGIASYKMAELSRQLIKKQAIVRVVMTQSATKFISPLTMQTLTKHPVLIDTFDEFDSSVVQHIELADWADVAIVAPATANIIGKMANGIGDDIASTTLLAVHSPRIIVPAMNENMYYNPATQRNLQQLTTDGATIIEPDRGFLAEGYTGKGRLPAVETIVAKVEDVVAKHHQPQILQGKQVVISAGGTVERIDPVRFISNDSSGKMGYALAEVAKHLGAEVHLVSTRPNLPVPQGVAVTYVESAQKMHEVMQQLLPTADYVIMAAAVSDYRIEAPSAQKIKSDGTSLTINLIENPDIVASLVTQKQPHQVIIGFAAETENLLEYARKKLEKKQVDWMVANDVSNELAGFHSDNNQVVILGKAGQKIETGLIPKADVAQVVWETVVHSQVGSHGS